MNQYENVEVARGLLSREREIFNFDIEIVKKYANEDSSIVEVGFGDAKFLISLKNEGFSNITGIDSSELIFKYGLEKTKGTNIKLYKKDMIVDDLNILFDVIIAYHFFTSIIASTERRKALQNTVGCMKKNGIIIVKSFVDENSKVIEVTDKYRRKIYIPNKAEFINELEKNELKKIEEYEKTEKGMTVQYIVLKKLA